MHDPRDLAPVRADDDEAALEQAARCAMIAHGRDSDGTLARRGCDRGGSGLVDREDAVARGVQDDQAFAQLQHVPQAGGSGNGDSFDGSERASRDAVARDESACFADHQDLSVRGARQSCRGDRRLSASDLMATVVEEDDRVGAAEQAYDATREIRCQESERIRAVVGTGAPRPVRGAAYFFFVGCEFWRLRSRVGEHGHGEGG